MDCAPNIIDFAPEEQTLFTVVQGTVFGIPAYIAACLAGACPKFAEQTLPINTSSIALASIVDFSKAALMTIDPSLVAEIDAKLPPKLPNGVLKAEQIYTGYILCKFMYC